MKHKFINTEDINSHHYVEFLCVYCSFRIILFQKAVEGLLYKDYIVSEQKPQYSKCKIEDKFRCILT